MWWTHVRLEDYLYTSWWKPKIEYIFNNKSFEKELPMKWTQHWENSQKKDIYITETILQVIGNSKNAQF